MQILQYLVLKKRVSEHGKIFYKYGVKGRRKYKINES